MTEMETLKEIKAKLLTKLSEEELEDKYEKMATANPLLKNKRMAYMIIASQEKLELSTPVPSASQEAFPVKLGELRDSEKQNFNLSGYLISDPRTITTKTGKLMTLMTMADDTGVIDISSFEEQADPILEGGFVAGDFITLSNMYWKDKAVFMPIFGKFSGIKKTESSYGLDKVVVHPVSELSDGKYFTIKGMITTVPDGEKRAVYHCETGHWFKSLSDADVGTQSMCAKCGVAMYVEKHTVGKNIRFGDETSLTLLDIGTFARMDDFNVMDEFILNGKFDNGEFKVSSSLAVKKV